MEKAALAQDTSAYAGDASAGLLIRPATRLQQAVAFAAAVLLLCLAAIWNGQPFFYPDTPTYLRGAETAAVKLLGPGRLKPWLAEPQIRAAQPGSPDVPGASAVAAPQPKHLTSLDDKVVLAGRSVYYGALLYASYLSTELWLAVAFQAMCVAYLLQLLLVRLWGITTGRFVVVIAALSAATPVAAYTGFLMPDIFAPLVVLAMGILAVYWRAISNTDRWAVPALLLFGLLAHSSHLALALLLLLLLAAAKLLARRWRPMSLAGLVVAAACIGGGLAGEWAFTKAVTAALGAPPLRLPHPMARLIDMGPGTDYLKNSCPQSGYAACAYLKNYPTSWENFMFSDDPAKGAFALADAQTKHRLSDEQAGFVLAVLRYDFLGVLRGVAVEAAHQLTHFGVDILGYADEQVAMYAGRVPERVYAGLQRSRPSAMNTWLTLTTNASVIASLVFAIVWWQRRRHANALAPAGSVVPTEKQRQFHDFAVIVVAGVVLNALVCAGLASSIDRFQARVVWLLPFLAMAVLAGASLRRRTASSKPGRPAPSPVATSAAATHAGSSIVSDSSLQGVAP